MDPDRHPDIAAWAADHSGSLDHVDFLTHHATVAEWLAICHVLWPDVIEVQGCFVRKRSFGEADFEGWREELRGDIPKIEATVNRLVLADVIDCGTSAADEKALKDIARTIARSWRVALQQTFPEREFTVVSRDTDDGPAVTFFSTA